MTGKRSWTSGSYNKVGATKKEDTESSPNQIQEKGKEEKKSIKSNSLGRLGDLIL